MITQLIDLSVPLADGASYEPWKPEFHYLTHEAEGLAWVKNTFGVTEKDLVLSDGKGAAFEEIRLITHAGTHVDAPWHYGPTSEGKKARTIDECPLEWFYGNGVVLDLRHKQPKELITSADLQLALERIHYTLRPFDIVLIMSGRDKFLYTPEYFEQPGMCYESTLWLVNQGIKVIGVDMYGFDRKFADMAEEFKRTGDGSIVWEAHFAGIQKEYCQIEKLANLDAIPQPYGFKVSCFPVKVQGASAGWCRPVAIVERRVRIRPDIAFPVEPPSSGGVPTVGGTPSVPEVPISGGTEPTHIVQQSDSDGAVNALKQVPTPKAQQVLQRHIHTNEQLIGTSQCKPNVTSDHAPGDAAASVTVTVTFTCTGEVYSQDRAVSMAAQLLTKQATTDLGDGYALVGNIATTVTKATLLGADTVKLTVNAEGMWVYQFSAAQKQALAKLMAGKVERDVQALLLKQKGVAKLAMQLSGGDKNTFPTNPGQIQVIVQQVQTPPTT